jgi:hypothetical protein
MLRATLIELIFRFFPNPYLFHTIPRVASFTVTLKPGFERDNPRESFRKKRGKPRDTVRKKKENTVSDIKWGSTQQCPNEKKKREFPLSFRTLAHSVDLSFSVEWGIVV